MKNYKLFIFILAAMCLGAYANAAVEPVVEYGDNYIVIQPEQTTSDLGLWTLRTPSDPDYFSGGSLEAIDTSYLEFTGNTLNGGTATSPLTYTFTCPKTAKYRLVMRMYQPLSDTELDDKRNDLYIKLEGNYTSACSYATADLASLHKFWGRGVRTWGCAHSLEAHVNNIKTLDKVVYNLIEGETYTFTIAGRAQGCSIDYMLFYEESLGLNVGSHVDIATANSDIYRPGLGLVEPTNVELDSVTYSIRTGTSINPQVVFEPVNSIKDVTWSTSDAQILEVDDNGKVTAVGSVGENATITVTSNENGLFAQSVITIVDWYSIAADSVYAELEENVIVEGDSTNMSSEVFPKYSDNDTVLWSSSDTDIATVDSTGKIKGVSAGTVAIRATLKSNSSIYYEDSVEIEAFVAPFIAYDNEAKYYGGTFYSNDTLEVTCNYHAGNFATVKDGIKFWLREIRPGWSVASEPHNYVVTSEAGKTSGTVTYKIPLTGVKPTAELSTGNFYFLFVSYKNSNEVDVNKGIDDPIIILADPTSADDLKAVSKIDVYPNPTADGLISVEGISDGDNSLKVYNISGTEVYNASLFVNDNRTELDLSHLQKGVYILVSEGDKSINTSIIHINK